MKGKNNSVPKKLYSPRSQRSLKHQHELEKEIDKVQKLIGYEERLLAIAEQSRMRYAKLAASGENNYISQRNLSESIAEIQERRQKIITFQEVIAGFRKEIKALQPTPAQAADRARKQLELARRGRERAEKDAAIDLAIDQVRRLLEARAELTAGIRALASEIDFEGNDWDAVRFDALMSSLPAAMQPTSKLWFTWFTGSERGKRPCRIIQETQIFPETLASAHFYQRNEEPLLTEKQCAEAEREDPRPLTLAEIEALHYSPKAPGPEPSGTTVCGMIRG